MPPDAERDLSYLWDIIDAAQAILEFTREMDLAAYLADRKSQMAVERALEIVGEAARRLSEPFRMAHPEIPWHGLVALRNVLAHEYGGVNQERLWRVVRENIPELLAALEPLLPPTPPAPGDSDQGPTAIS